VKIAVLLGKQESLMSAEKRNEAGGSPGFVARLVIGSLYADHLLMLDIIVRIWTSKLHNDTAVGNNLILGKSKARDWRCFKRYRCWLAQLWGHCVQRNATSRNNSPDEATSLPV